MRVVWVHLDGGGLALQRYAKTLRPALSLGLHPPARVFVLRPIATAPAAASTAVLTSIVLNQGQSIWIFRLAAVLALSFVQESPCNAMVRVSLTKLHPLLSSLGITVWSRLTVIVPAAGSDELRVSYIIGGLCFSEGYKSGIERGYPLTLRLTDPHAINSATNAHGMLFDRLRVTTLRDYLPSSFRGSERDALRVATLACLKQSLATCSQARKNK